ncbi:MAG: Gfo/Idh/MocA family oxidoreductase, partial [Phycisphaerae bacterium]|nr:Gfo/Idh/MocA family oxidoreductase [Phycisphaerae bacterium]
MTADSVPPDRPAIGVGVVGLGFMGRTHVAAYVGASRAGFPCRLVAVCDSDPRRRAGEAGESGNLQTGAAAFDPASVRAHGCFESMLADPDVRLISICTPTQTHVELASAALRA